MLTLSLAGIVVALDKFTSTDYPRVSVQQLSAVEFSIYGTPALSGTLVEPKYLWNIGCLVSPEQRQLIEAIAYEFHTRRRLLQECDILLTDVTVRIIERTRTRAIAPNTVETLINGGTHLSYFPVCKCAITDGPKFVQQGIYDALTMVLTETTRTTP